MNVQIVQFRADSQRIGEVEEAIEHIFAAVAAAAPAGIEYTAARVDEGSELLLMLTFPDDAANTRLEIPEAGAFRGRVGEWAGGPVTTGDASRHRAVPRERRCRGALVVVTIARAAEQACPQG